MTRVVLDASVLLSATVGRHDSPPSLLLDAVRVGQIEAVACEQLLKEVREGRREVVERIAWARSSLLRGQRQSTARPPRFSRAAAVR